MRRLWFFSILFIGFLVLSICFGRALGQQNKPANMGLFTSGDCAQPCWNGIQPGKTTLDEAETILRANPQFATDIGRENPVVLCNLSWTMRSQPIFYGCIQSAKDNVITRLWLEAYPMHDGVSLTEALPALGSPTRILVCSAADGILITMYFTDYVGITAWDEDGSGLSFPSLDDTDPIVWSIGYTKPGTKPTYSPDMPYWQGFTRSQTKYYRGEC